MLFLGDKNNQLLSKGLSDELSLTLNYPELTIFPDGERRVRVLQNVVDEDVVFVKTSTSNGNPDSFVVETAFLVDALKRSGARSIAGVIPYFPYCRADHVFRSGESVPLEVVIKLFEGVGLSKVIFIDPHTLKMPEMFSIEVKNLSALPIFAEKIKELDRGKSVIVTPDRGGLRRAEKLAKLLNRMPVVVLDKLRDDLGKVKIKKVNGEITDTCFIIDDIISSGGTILKASLELRKRGAKKIYVMATHAIFSKDSKKNLQDSHLVKIFITDTIPIKKAGIYKNLEILSTKSLIKKAINK